MTAFIFTNVSVYKAIAEDAYTQAIALLEINRTPKPDGNGYILHYDPESKSFKSAMVTIVFAGMWLEALLHLQIVHKLGEEKFREFDRKSYEEKLMLLGVSDERVLSNVKRFRESRKDLVHEKAHFNQGTIKTAQDEAGFAISLMHELEAVVG